MNLSFFSLQIRYSKSSGGSGAWFGGAMATGPGGSAAPSPRDPVSCRAQLDRQFLSCGICFNKYNNPKVGAPSLRSTAGSRRPRFRKHQWFRSLDGPSVYTRRGAHTFTVEQMDCCLVLLSLKRRDRFLCLEIVLFQLLSICCPTPESELPRSCRSLQV